jgi:hypothetical protein
MSPMNPRLMRPLAAGIRPPVFATAGYTRLWSVTTQSGGNITGSAETDTGYYAVKWWDSSVDIYDSGDPFSKSAAGNQRAFEVYPCDIAGVPGGQFDGFDLSDNSLTQLRAEGVTLSSSAGTPGYWTYWYSYYISGTPGVAAKGIVSDNLLSAEALDQFYTDLDAGTGSLFVAGNPGIDAGDPTIATAKGYTVFGSVSPGTALLLNFNGTNGSTTFTDSSPNGLAVTANGDAQISTAQSKYGGASGFFDGNGDYLSAPDDEAFSFGTGDFTVELWFYATSLSTQYAGLVGKGRSGIHASDNWSLEIDNPTTLSFWNWASSSAISASGISVNTWHHVAVCRLAGVTTIFLDGVAKQTSSTLGGSIEFNSGATLIVGANAHNISGRPFSGYIDDLRILYGIALYTANFTPPTSELEVYP